MSRVHIVAGGQYGSEGKGAFTAALVKRLGTSILVRVAGPNAGHTAYDDQGRRWALRQIPVGAVVNLDAPVVIGQQSEIDLEVLMSEVGELEDAGIPIRERILVDLNATVIEDIHKEAESRDHTLTHGSTRKGIGVARANRLMRDAKRIVDTPFSDLQIGDTVEYLRAGLAGEYEVVIEGTQGYGLGLHTNSYPWTTSSNCRPGDFLAMTGLQPWEVEQLVPWLVFRAHPIRIAGNSGPLENETTWEEIGQPTEYTTVTKKPRRIGLWDEQLAKEALRAAGGGRALSEPSVVFTFFDYLHPQFAGATELSEEMVPEVTALRGWFGNFNPWISYVGTGPTTGVWL